MSTGRMISDAVRVRSAAEQTSLHAGVARRPGPSLEAALAARRACRLVKLPSFAVSGLNKKESDYFDDPEVCCNVMN